MRALLPFLFLSESFPLHSVHIVLGACFLSLAFDTTCASHIYRISLGLTWSLYPLSILTTLKFCTLFSMKMAFSFVHTYPHCTLCGFCLSHILVNLSFISGIHIFLPSFCIISDMLAGSSLLYTLVIYYPWPWSCLYSLLYIYRIFESSSLLFP